MLLFKQETAYEMRIRDWSSDVCSSDLKQGETFQIIFSPQLSQRRILDHPVFPSCKVRLGHPGWKIPWSDPVDANAPPAPFCGQSASRSEERRVGNRGVSTCRDRGSPYH